MKNEDDFKNMVDLLAVYSEAANRMSVLQSEINGELLELVDGKKSEYSQLQKALTESETALELLARKHPEWFAEKKSIKTPYGEVKFHSSSKLKVKNEELSIYLIEEMVAADTTIYIREEKHLNLEALEKLDDDVLMRMKIERVRDDSFSVKEAKLDLGKAVKEAAKKEKVAA